MNTEIRWSAFGLSEVRWPFALSFQAKHNTATPTYQNEVHRDKSVSDFFDGTLGHFKIEMLWDYL